MNFSELEEFRKEFKKLSKKYLSLNEDLELFKKFLAKIPLGNSNHFNIVTQNRSTKIVKARLFCRYLKKTSLRIIYSFHEELQKIEFIEIYFKGDRANEDRKRIHDYLN